jgi:hypothetical protein
MDDDAFQGIESQLAAVGPTAAPGGLRAAVLDDVARELRATRWDRRMMRAAAVLFVVGIGLNAAIGLRSSASNGSHLRPNAHTASQQSLVEAAVVVAEATDAATGSRFARQLAAMSGNELTADEVAEIEAAVERGASHPAANGNKG